MSMGYRHACWRRREPSGRGRLEIQGGASQPSLICRYWRPFWPDSLQPGVTFPDSARPISAIYRQACALRFWKRNQPDVIIRRFPSGADRLGAERLLHIRTCDTHEGCMKNRDSTTPSPRTTIGFTRTVPYGENRHSMRTRTSSPRPG
jgi:hypothetical protein